MIEELYCPQCFIPLRTAGQADVVCPECRKAWPRFDGLHKVVVTKADIVAFAKLKQRVADGKIVVGPEEGRRR